MCDFYLIRNFKKNNRLEIMLKFGIRRSRVLALQLMLCDFAQATYTASSRFFISKMR